MVTSLSLAVAVTWLTAWLAHVAVAQWIPRDVYRAIIAEFETLEAERSKIHVRGVDKRVSAPFISGNGFRAAIRFETHLCEESNRCRVTPEAITNGSCVYVVSDMFDYFVKDIVPRIPGPYKIISHNGDLSTPDGQSDAPRIGMSRYVTSDILSREYAAGRLLAHHGQNLWWANNSFSPRPPWAHCLPIGFENRQWKMGGNLRGYTGAIEEFILKKPMLSLAEQDKKPLLLIAFYPKNRVPDRQKVLTTIGAIPPKGQPKPINTWYNETDLSHSEWLAGITEHRFVLAPFGHGLDTHRYADLSWIFKSVTVTLVCRISEILVMGGIPVMRRSTISSCFDDTDNVIGSSTRGSIPVVILDTWQDLTKDRLEKEWQRIKAVPAEKWDWRRVFLEHWLERIGC
jgi:hypothetical protein